MLRYEEIICCKGDYIFCLVFFMYFADKRPDWANLLEVPEILQKVLAGCPNRARWVEFVGIVFKYYTRAHVYTRSIRIVRFRCRVQLSRPSL